MLLEKSFCESNNRFFRRHRLWQHDGANRILETVRASEVVSFSRIPTIEFKGSAARLPATCKLDHPDAIDKTVGHHVRKLRAG